MRFTILLRVDESGSWPVLLESGQVLEGDRDSRWRFVASIDDRDVAIRVVEMVKARCHEERRNGRRRPESGLDS
jgi:hypothetical protein